MGCGTSTIKYLLFLFNLIFALGGLVLIIIGSIIQWNLNYYNEFFEGSIMMPSIIIIVIGSIIFIVAFFGCCGSIRESHCMIITFSIFLIIIFIVTLVGGILAIVFQDNVDIVLKSTMKDLQYAYGETGPEGKIATESWDTLQQSIKCCGVDSSDDWRYTNYYNANNKLPDSCKCNNSEEYCALGHYARGCYKPFLEFIHAAEIIMGAVAITIAVIQLIGVIFACTLASSIKQKKSWNV